MELRNNSFWLFSLVSALAVLPLPGVTAAQTPELPPAAYAALPSETPARFQPTTDAFDYTKRDVMIRVVQDVRGKYGSEGDYVMNRPIRGPQNPTPVDHATDTYDTIEWLVQNVPESNGKVGVLGISYEAS